MTTANKVTIGRIILVPFFVVQMLYYFRTGDELHRYLAMVSFLIATISDGIDGYLARHRGQATQVGAFLDAAATAAQNFFRAQVEQAVQPELFRDIGFIAGKGLVKLVVVGQLQLGKELIDGIDMGVGDRLLGVTCL